MPSKNETAELLQIPPGTARPTAYQILGLTPLENDAQKIAAAVENRTRYLRARRADASPAAWKAAASAFEKARSIVTDAAAKQKYDQQLRRELASSPPDPPATPSAHPADIPPTLAELLPAADPAAPFDAQDYLREHPELASEPEEEDVDRLLFGDEPPEEASIEPDEIVMAAVVPDETAPPAPRVVHGPRRRRRSLPIANLVMGLVVVLLFVGIGGTLYALIRQNQQGGDSRITAAKPAPLPEDATGQPDSEPPVADPVMGNLPAADSAPPINTGDAAAEGAGSGFQMPEPRMLDDDAIDQSMNEAATPDRDASPTPNESPNAGDDAEPMEPVVEQPTPEPADPSEAPAPMTEQVAAGEAALQRAQEAVRQNAWDEMGEAAERAADAAATGDQRQQAALLDRLVRYALEYRRAIEAGGRSIAAGDSFELQPGVRVGMVENSGQRIVIRVAGRNRSYDGYDDLPPVLKHAFARMDLDANHPTTIAYKAAYQAISRQSTPEHRQQAFDWWREAAAESDEINVDGFEELVQQLFPES